VSATAFIAGYRPFQFTDFSGGLNLRDKADAVGDQQAIDLLNVEFTPRGAIHQRDGYIDLIVDGSQYANRVDSLTAFDTVSGYHQLVAGCGTRLEALTTTGAIIASVTGLTGGPWQFCRYGDLTHEYLYASNGTDAPRRWDGAAWTAPTATVDGTAGRTMPKAGVFCATAQQAGASSSSNAAGRLVATAFGTNKTAGPNGAETTPSRVYMSNPGRPEVWETDGDLTVSPVRGKNYFDLTPGDGEAIIAAISWRELTFIFKQTKFFVLWGESAFDDGTPVFHVREVVNNIGLGAAHAVCTGRDGVYFMSPHGIYRTTGGDPVLLSDIIAPLWTQDPEVYFTGYPISLGDLGLVRALWHSERVYFAVPSSTPGAVNDRVLVYDSQHQWWSIYDWPASALTTLHWVNTDRIAFGYSTGPRGLGVTSPGSTLDGGLLPDRPGRTINSRWRSGWSDYGNSQQRTLRETKVWGTGAVNVQFSVDYNRTLLTAAEALFGLDVNWPSSGTWGEWIAANNGVWPGGGQVADVLVRHAVRGTLFSTQFSNNAHSPTWSVHRVARHLREIREPSIR